MAGATLKPWHSSFRAMYVVAEGMCDMRTVWWGSQTLLSYF